MKLSDNFIKYLFIFIAGFLICGVVASYVSGLVA